VRFYRRVRFGLASGDAFRGFDAIDRRVETGDERDRSPPW